MRAAHPGRQAVALTLGKFDGVHAGHRHIAAYLMEAAGRRGVESMVLVLHPNPALVLAGVNVPSLTTVPERQRRLRAIGVDRVEHLPFTPSLAALSAEEFIHRMLSQFDLAAVVVGADFGFGRGRSGTVRDLESAGARHGFDVVQVPALSLDGAPVSSRRIRAGLQAGGVAEVRRLLRAPPYIRGTVVRGAARGRTIGFPTANIALDADYALPANGIYAVRAKILGTAARSLGGAVTLNMSLEGVASVGVRPTFDNGERLVEVYLFDFDQDIYGLDLVVEFLAFQRPEERFDHVRELVAQIEQDVLEAKRLLSDTPTDGWQVESGPAGRQVVATGHDLAAACTLLAEGVRHARTDAPWSTRTGTVERVEISGSPIELVSGWLAVASGPDSGTSEAYASEDGRLWGVVRSAVAATSRPALPGSVEFGPAHVRLAAGLD